VIQVFFFKLMFRQLYEGNKSNIMILGCSLKDVVGPQAVAADKRVRTTGGEEKEVHWVIEFIGFVKFIRTELMKEL